jgi:hypothetical protein
MLDEILITGLPEKFPAENLATLICQETSERGLPLPPLIWQSGVTENKKGAVLFVLREPVSRSVMIDSLVDCIDGILMNDMKMDMNDQVYAMEPCVGHNFEAAAEYIRRNYPGPHPTP